MSPSPLDIPNTKQGQIRIVKKAVPNDPQDFTFTAGGGLSPTSFDLDDVSDPTLPNDLGDLQRREPGHEHDLSPGEIVTSTFTNIRAGQIVVVMDSVPTGGRLV